MIDILVPVMTTLLVFMSSVLARIATTLFHELGHGIPAMIFTKEKVNVFLGSYGDVEKSKHLAFGNKLSIYFMLNPLKWSGGMAQHGNNNLTTLKNLVILSFGPLCSLFLATIAIWVLYSFNLHGFLKLLSIVFLISAIFDLRNLYPNGTPIKLYDGTCTYRDGYQILRLIRYRGDKNMLAKAYEMYNSKDYRGVISLFEMINPGYIDQSILPVIISAYCMNNDYQNGKKFYTSLLKNIDSQYLDSNAFFYLGLIESRLGDNDLAMDFYNKSIELDHRNTNSISNRGYTFTLLRHYEEAINDFDAVIAIEPESAYAFANRGHAKIKSGLKEEGLTEINKAISLDNTNSYAYRNLGLYYFDDGNYRDAATNFQLAYNLDSNTHMIEEFKKMAADKLSITA